MINLHLICYVISKEITELKEKFDMTEGAEASSGVILDTNI